MTFNILRYKLQYIMLNLHIPTYYYVLAIVIILLVWFIKRRISIALLIGYCFLILSATVLARSSHVLYRCELIPFVTYKKALYSADFRWEIISNVIMFIPIGFLVPFSIKKSVSLVRLFFLTILYGLLISIGIEILQFITKKGLAETDDLISNSIGIAIGFTCSVLMKLITNSLVNHRERTLR